MLHLLWSPLANSYTLATFVSGACDIVLSVFSPLQISTLLKSIQTLFKALEIRRPLAAHHTLFVQQRDIAFCTFKANFANGGYGNEH